MKILYVITGGDIGGAQRHLLYLSEWFTRKGHEVHVVVGEDGPFITELENRGIGVEIIDIPRNIRIGSDLKALWKLFRLIQREKFDVVHSHSSIAGILTRTAAFFNRVDKNIFTAHGFVFTDPTFSRKKKRFYLFLEKAGSWISSNIITVSNFDYQMGKENGINEKKMYVIPNGIPAKAILSLTEWREKQLRLQKNQKQIIGFVGRFAAEKNMDMILRVASLFKEQQNHKVEFWLIGDGPLFDRYSKEIDSKGLSSIIRLKGSQENVLDWMDQMHVMLITSHKEGLPYVLLEACGRGLPVISTDVGGVKEVLDPENNKKLLVKINDDHQMHQKLTKLLSNDSDREAIGEYLLKRAPTFSVEKMCVETNKLYSS